MQLALCCLLKFSTSTWIAMRFLAGKIRYTFLYTASNGSDAVIPFSYKHEKKDILFSGEALIVGLVDFNLM